MVTQTVIGNGSTDLAPCRNWCYMGDQYRLPTWKTQCDSPANAHRQLTSLTISPSQHPLTLVQPVFTHDGFDLSTLHCLEFDLGRFFQVDTMLLEQSPTLLVIV